MMTTKKKFTLERTFRASAEDVWELWTTREGIEQWWGPDGFAVTVQKIDLREGGELLYTMTAVDPPKVEFMKNAGMPVSTKCRLTFTEVVPLARLRYTHVADFIPGVAPYDVEHLVEIRASGGEVRMTLTIDAMHDETWTQRAVSGWEMELGKLEKVIAKSGS
jgi:uncharacterized protein YndB with AHSA1/START domain